MNLLDDLQNYRVFSRWKSIGKFKFNMKNFYKRSNAFRNYIFKRIMAAPFKVEKFSNNLKNSKIQIMDKDSQFRFVRFEDFMKDFKEHKGILQRKPKSLNSIDPF